MADELATPETRDAFQQETLKKAGLRNRRALDKFGKEVKDILLANHTETMGAIGRVADQVEVHNRWIKARDDAQAEIEKEKAEAEREKNEQAMKAQWMADQVAQDKAKQDAADALTVTKRKERHDRWNPYVMVFVASLGAAVLTLISYVLENLDKLRWGTQAYAISFVVLALSAGIVVLFKLNL